MHLFSVHKQPTCACPAHPWRPSRIWNVRHSPSLRPKAPKIRLDNPLHRCAVIDVSISAVSSCHGDGKDNERVRTEERAREHGGGSLFGYFWVRCGRLRDGAPSWHWVPPFSSVCAGVLDSGNVRSIHTWRTSTLRWWVRFFKKIQLRCD